MIGTNESSSWAAGTVARIIGWGTTSEGGPVSDVLLKADVPLVADSDVLLGLRPQMDPNTMVCAGDGIHDTCQGDSGGPLHGPRRRRQLGSRGNHLLGQRLRQPGLSRRLHAHRSAGTERVDRGAVSASIVHRRPGQHRSDNRSHLDLVPPGAGWVHGVRLGPERRRNLRREKRAERELGLHDTAARTTWGFERAARVAIRPSFDRSST